MAKQAAGALQATASNQTAGVAMGSPAACLADYKGCNFTGDAITGLPALMECGASKLCKVGKGCTPQRNCVDAYNKCTPAMGCKREYTASLQKAPSVEARCPRLRGFVVSTIKLNTAGGGQVQCPFLSTNRSRLEHLVCRFPSCQQHTSMIEPQKLKNARCITIWQATFYWLNHVASYTNAWCWPATPRSGLIAHSCACAVQAQPDERCSTTPC